MIIMTQTDAQIVKNQKIDLKVIENIASVVLIAPVILLTSNRNDRPRAPPMTGPKAGPDCECILIPGCFQE